MEATNLDIKEKIIKYSSEIGVGALGFLKAELFFPNMERFEYADKKGYLSNFINKKKENINLEDYKTIICVLVPYPNPLFDNPNSSTLDRDNTVYGQVSSSSWGLDYHRVLKNTLEEMVDYIQLLIDIKKYHIAVDTNPMSEREIAAKAGLGWIGRNSNLINPDLGSFIFIGEIYLDLILPIGKKEPVIDLCGNCNLCVEACPVGAIDGVKRIVNTQLCLSQQTQEKETFDDFLKKKIKETKYIYGCDICQIVCPWNNKKQEFNSMFNPVKEEVFINLKELTLESNKTFSKKYGHLSGSWRGKKPWQKNAKIILSDFDF